MNVKPLDDRIVVRPSAQETKTESGIYLPETSKERPMTGKVIAVGPGRRLDNGERAKPTVKKGDTVVFGKYAGTEVEVKGDEHLILRESELLGILDG
ncbi:co-chaperone GroES [Leptolyngbya valderiana BDU 20041]|nr:co-chaperone GroES [Leptolyngbya valderiana BDU 20041]